MFLLSTFSLSRLNNAEATAFYINVQKAITESQAANLGIDAALNTKYNTTLQKLVDQVYMAQGSALTATMKTADSKRTQIMKRIRLRLQMVEVCDDNAALLACKEKVQTHLLTKYTSDVSKMALQQKTAVISGFITDLNGKLDEDDIDALQIGQDITQLTLANNEFVTAYNLRSSERASAATQVTQTLRNEMGECYQIISFIVQLMANDTTEANATKAAACQEFIGVVNIYLADVKKRYLQRTDKSSEEGSTSTDNGQQSANTPAGGSSSDNTPAGGTPADDSSSDNTPAGGNQSDNNPAGSDTDAGGQSNPDDVETPDWH